MGQAGTWPLVAIICGGGTSAAPAVFIMLPYVVCVSLSLYLGVLLCKQGKDNCGLFW